MNRLARNIIFVVIGLLIISLASQQQLLAGNINIVGEINDQYQLVSSEDGAVYEIAETELGNKLIYEHRGEKMRVFGKLIKPVQEVTIDDLPKGLVEVVSFEDVPE